MMSLLAALAPSSSSGGAGDAEDDMGDDDSGLEGDATPPRHSGGALRKSLSVQDLGSVSQSMMPLPTPHSASILDRLPKF